LQANLISKENFIPKYLPSFLKGFILNHLNELEEVSKFFPEG